MLDQSISVGLRGPQDHDDLAAQQHALVVAQPRTVLVQGRIVAVAATAVVRRHPFS